MSQSEGLQNDWFLATENSVFSVKLIWVRLSTPFLCHIKLKKRKRNCCPIKYFFFYYPFLIVIQKEKNILFPSWPLSICAYCLFGWVRFFPRLIWIPRRVLTDFLTVFWSWKSGEREVSDRSYSTKNLPSRNQPERNQITMPFATSS